MTTGRRLKELVLSSDERTKLEQWVRRPKTSQHLALRARIVLQCASGLTNTQVAAGLRITVPTVGKWRSRFLADRLQGLVDEPRPEAPRSISDAQIEEVIGRTLESKPEAATHWSTRSMAKVTGLSQATIARIWRAFGLQPHRTDAFKLSTDPFFVEKVRDVVGLYLHPPQRAIVLCVDEKSQVQALNRTQPLLPLGPGPVERGTHDYEREALRKNPPGLGGFVANRSSEASWRSQEGRRRLVSLQTGAFDAKPFTRSQFDYLWVELSEGE